MKQYLLLLAAVLLFANADGQQLNSAEYFFDTDPGVGNGNALVVATGDSILFSTNISTLGLASGFHYLYIRARDNNGHWGLSERRLFYIRAITTAANLSAAEYFFDNDPGVGNANQLTVSSGDSILFSGNISTASLTNGFHFLYTRVEDLNGKWSLGEKRLFYINTIVAASQVSSAEYYFDDDPGVGNGNNLTITGGDTILFVGVIPTGSLATGFHSLNIRAMAADGRWAIAEHRMFYIENTPAIVPPLVAAEFFVNVDTGFGQCGDLVVTPGDSIDFSGIITLGDTAQGIYYLYIRVMDSLNVWSLYERDTFEISNNVGVRVLHSSNQTVLFQNYPNPFNNTTYIEYYLGDPGEVSISISDMLGNLVKQISIVNPGRGKHTIRIDKSLLGEGCYFYKLVSGKFSDTKKMIVIK